MAVVSPLHEVVAPAPPGPFLTLPCSLVGVTDDDAVQMTDGTLRLYGTHFDATFDRVPPGTWMSLHFDVAGIRVDVVLPAGTHRTETSPLRIQSDVS